MSSPNAARSIGLIHSIHPNNEAYFHSLASTSEEIRTMRHNVHDIMCTTCMKTEKDLGQPMRKCGKCHVVWYCSKECQTKHWPKHKPICGEAGIPKLIRSLLSNALLTTVLKGCFVLHYDLLNKSMADAPLMARVDLAVEPADILEFAQMYLEGPLDRKVQGMIQFNGFRAGTSADMLSLTPQRREIWRKTRDEANAKGLRTDQDPVVLVEFGYGDGLNSITSALLIDSKTKMIMKESMAEGFIMTSAITGEVTTLPCNIETSMEFMNMHIRADKKNQLLLRTEMQPFDVQYIRRSATNFFGGPATTLNQKIAREAIYRSIYEMLLTHKTGELTQKTS
ncbi:hypothetical protein MSAN_01100300 [Mycena sanguinolenta]|uniref:MYND-type domain-containing protein n=1 Tax=Mycena sanguinolenta TaxID=230812 RepID=A0A8H6YT90_9AGAR|nr:hypothetical protein MSAN_01100300 [Mycena sanguinolenta]